jgi:hypothetical protein
MATPVQILHFFSEYNAPRRRTSSIVNALLSDIGGGVLSQEYLKTPQNLRRVVRNILDQACRSA